MSVLDGGQRGFITVELLVTVILAAGLFTSFTLGFASIQNINKKAVDIMAADRLAFSKIQEYENRPFASLPSTAPAGTLVEVEDFTPSLPDNLEPPRSGKVYINTVSNSLKQVVVDLSFGSFERRLQYGSFIQRQGVGR